ncbi:FHA domain-containing protein [Microscilla marina]|uniref:FHA domain containing protein n=1 Tax=Microscilla marina ATCC 23134 TaxID=313606 RepID=A1ZS62_MICM2|nr:FHA domain-containing protein [Microscilla marina]EAY26785.1 FHA domain containing protein [Microscilla marina ATCC 23134]
MKIVTVGRAPDNNIILFDDKVSGKHASFTLTDKQEYYVQDFNSTNGTFVNGNKIGNEPFQILPKDTVKIGKTIVPWQTYLSDRFEPAKTFPKAPVRQ